MFSNFFKKTSICTRPGRTKLPVLLFKEKNRVKKTSSHTFWNLIFSQNKKTVLKILTFLENIFTLLKLTTIHNHEK
jgi:hypothetical protein